MTASWLDQLEAAEKRGACGSVGMSPYECGCDYCLHTLFPGRSIEGDADAS